MDSPDELPMPPVLHKLMPPSFGGEILPFLTDGMIRFAPPGAQNDPFECRVIDKTDYDVLISDAVDKRGKTLLSQKLPPKQFAQKFSILGTLKQQLKNEFVEGDRVGRQKLWDDIYANRDDKVGMLCLTENVLSSSMWSHYADRHRGVAIGFNAFELAKLGMTPAFTKLARVLYNSDPVTLDMTKDKRLGEGDPFLLKSPDWAHEREWRMLTIFNNLGPIKKVIGTDELGYPVTLVQLHTDLIQEIRLGCLASSNVEQKVIDFAKNAGRPIQIFRMRHSPKSFSLQEEPLKL